MPNFLDARCPQCGNDSQIDIQATVWVRACPDGTDADAAGDCIHEYTPETPALCGACNCGGELGEFERAGDDLFEDNGIAGGVVEEVLP